MIAKIICKNCKNKINNEAVRLNTKIQYYCDNCRYYCAYIRADSNPKVFGFFFEKSENMISYSIQKTYYNATIIVYNNIDYGVQGYNIPFSYDEHYKLYKIVMAKALLK